LGFSDKQRFSGLKRAIPEIPPILPFSKGGEALNSGFGKKLSFPPLEKRIEAQLLAIQKAKM
jgi:hypothetical protein